MAYDSTQTSHPDAVTWDHGPNGRTTIIRMGTPTARVFGDAWKAQADAENAARMAKKAKREALPSLADQAAALAVKLAERGTV